MPACLIRIAGRVQGIGYRAWAVKTATKLGLKGWVRNLSDGAVEILALGDQEALALLAEQCRRGPMLAKVTHLAVIPADPAEVTEPDFHAAVSVAPPA